MHEDNDLEERKRKTYGLLEPETQNNPTKEKINFVSNTGKPKKSSRKKRGLVFFLLIIIILFGIFKTIKSFSAPDITQNPLDYDPITLEPKKPEGFLKRLGLIVFNKEPQLEGQKDDRINILLLGMGGPGHDGPFLTDTIIVASIKPSTNQVALTSIPRDLEVSIPGHNKKKINHANHFGEMDNPDQGGELVLKTIEKNFNITIPYYLRVDFKAFSDIVDSVNGITIDVEKSFIDTEYPAANDKYQTILFSKGPQTMDGARALTYARSRHGNNGEGSDFARAKRQQKLILALKQKILSFKTLANPITINNILKNVDKHFATNMSFADMLSFIKLARELDSLDNVEISTLVLDTNNDSFLESDFNQYGEFILKPKTGNFENINNALETVFTYAPPLTDNTPKQVEPELLLAKVELQNGTWSAGLAARIREKLRSEKILVYKISNTETRPFAKSGIYTVSDTLAPDTISMLNKTLNIPVKEVLPDGEIFASSTDILVILGEDYIE